MSWSVSLLATRHWCEAKHNRFFNSRFSSLKWFTWLVRFSKCLFLRHLDRRADSLFDIILRFFRSSTEYTVRPRPVSEPEGEWTGRPVSKNDSSWWISLGVKLNGTGSSENMIAWTGGKKGGEKGRKQVGGSSIYGRWEGTRGVHLNFGKVGSFRKKKLNI